MRARWRAVVAALLNPDLRAVLAETLAVAPLPPARRERAVARLVEAGLVRVTDDGGVVLDEQSLRGMLSASPVARREGPERFLDGAGRIDRYPVRAPERRMLLAWVATQAFRAGEVLSESQTNERLLRFTDDTAALRRYLIDAELVERTRSGSEYALAESAG